MSRRDLSKAYKERALVGGVYTITNTVNGKYLLDCAADLASVENRFQFAVTTGSAFHPKLRADLAASGASSFRLDILEELEQRPGQTPVEFAADLKALEELCRANLDPAKAY